MNEKTQVRAFRDQLIESYRGRHVTFNKTSRQVNGRQRTVFNDGPQLTFDSGYTHTNLFKVLFQMQILQPTRAQLIKYLVNYGLPDEPGLYLLEAKDKRMVITTKSIAKSYAKVLWEILNTDKGMDLFIKRLVAAPQVSFKILYTGPANHRLGANYAGMYDTMNPAIVLGDKGYNYRKFNAAYRKGLVAGGNFVTLTIENLLAQGSRPSFISEKEALAWNKDFIETDVIPDDSFSSALLQTIDAHNRVEFGGF